MNDELNFEWAHCNQCLRLTKHEVVASRSQKESEPIEDNGHYYAIEWEIIYTMLECRGCASVMLRRIIIGPSDSMDEKCFPPSISRQIPRWHNELPFEFVSLMKEIYSALHADSQRLALMGTRALVDLFMNTTIGDIGGFKQKIDKLVEEGYLSKINKDILLPALDAGHAVTHRAHFPTTGDVNAVFDIIENLLQTMVLKKKAEKLKKNTPKRNNIK